MSTNAVLLIQKCHAGTSDSENTLREAPIFSGTRIGIRHFIGRCLLAFVSSAGIGLLEFNCKIL